MFYYVAVHKALTAGQWKKKNLDSLSMNVILSSKFHKKDNKIKNLEILKKVVKNQSKVQENYEKIVQS